MKRNPSLHIRKSDLILVLESMGFYDSEKIAIDLLRKSRPYSIKNRQFILSKKITQKKITRHQVTSSPIIQKINLIIEDQRRKAGHKFIRSISRDSKSYTTLGQVACDAEEFADTFQLFDRSDEDLYKKYITIGLQLIGKKYAIQKFVYYKDRIFQAAENEYTLKHDKNPSLSQNIYKYYCDKVKVNTEFTIDFVLTAELLVANQFDAEYKQWIDAQFDGLVFLDAVPEPNQLHSAKSKERYSIFARQKKRPKSNLEEEYRNLLGDDN